MNKFEPVQGEQGQRGPCMVRAEVRVKAGREGLWESLYGG